MHAPMTRLYLALALAAVPGWGNAEEQWWHGTWSLEDGRCATTDEGRLGLTATEAAFYGSTCTVTAATPYASTDMILSLTCSGEGETWSYDALLIRRTPSVMTWTEQGDDSPPRVYHRCP